MPICINAETEAAARSRRRRTWRYVEESDAATTKVYALRQLGIQKTTMARPRLARQKHADDNQAGRAETAYPSQVLS